MLSPLSTNQYSAPDQSFSKQSDIKRLSVKEKVSYYEMLCANMQEQTTPRSSIGRKSSHNYRRTNSIIPETVEDKENQQQNNLTTPLKTTKKSNKLPVLHDRIERRRKPQLEKEVSCNIFQEKPVECIKEEKEERNRKIEILERKVSSVRRKHRDSVQQGDHVRAEVLFKELQSMEKRLAKQELSLQDEDAQLDEHPSSKEELTEESSCVEFNEQELDGDLWGGIVNVMADKYCVDEESTWRTFSSYCVTVKGAYSELSIDSNSILHDDIFFSEEGEEEESYSFTTEKNNLKLINMYDELEVKYDITNQQLEDARLELTAFRARLYEALHQLAKTEYQMRVYEGQLLQSQTNGLQLEQELEKQKIILDEYERQEIEREIRQLREETILRRKQIDDLRKQIRSSIASLPADEQTDLMVEDPFIECSVRLLDSKRTSIQRLSLLEKKLSTLISTTEIRIEKKKTKKKRNLPDLFSPKSFSSKFRTRGRTRFFGRFKR